MSLLLHHSSILAMPSLKGVSISKVSWMKQNRMISSDQLHPSRLLACLLPYLLVLTLICCSKIIFYLNKLHRTITPTWNETIRQYLEVCYSCLQIHRYIVNKREVCNKITCLTVTWPKFTNKVIKHFISSLLHTLTTPPKPLEVGWKKVCRSCIFVQLKTSREFLASQSFTSPSLLPVKNKLVFGMVDTFVTLPEDGRIKDQTEKPNLNSGEYNAVSLNYLNEPLVYARPSHCWYHQKYQIWCHAWKMPWHHAQS